MLPMEQMCWLPYQPMEKDETLAAATSIYTNKMPLEGINQNCLG